MLRIVLYVTVPSFQKLDLIRIHLNLTPYVMVSFNKSFTHKPCSRLQSTGKKDAPSQSEEMSGQPAHPALEVDTDVRLESEHGRMKKSTKSRFQDACFCGC